MAANAPELNAAPGSRDGAPLILRAPAKINLGLRVLSRRPDGYHGVQTLLTSVDLWDTLTFEPAGDGLELTCDAPSVPTDRTNLVWRAFLGLEAFLGWRLPGVRIHLQKRIPAGRGLGGGSSDAAAALVGLNRLFALRLGRRALHRLLAEVGMDAPYFLYGGLALAVGRGEQVFPLSVNADLSLVVLIPDFAIATPDAYRGLPRIPAPEAGRGSGAPIDRLPPFSRPDPSGSGHADQLPAEGFLNDLERSTVVHSARSPDAIGRMRRALTAAGAGVAAMSGSGSAVFGVFPDPEAAARAASRLSGPTSGLLSGSRVRAIATRTISRDEHRTALFGDRPDGAWPRG